MTLRADITQPHPEAYALLDFLGNKSHAIPYLAIFPADRPDKPHVLESWWTKQDLLNILAKCPDPSELQTAQIP